jgi:hypothetical protein
MAAHLTASYQAVHLRPTPQLSAPGPNITYIHTHESKKGSMRRERKRGGRIVFFVFFLASTREKRKRTHLPDIGAGHVERGHLGLGEGVGVGTGEVVGTIMRGVTGDFGGALGLPNFLKGGAEGLEAEQEAAVGLVRVGGGEGGMWARVPLVLISSRTS